MTVCVFHNNINGVSRQDFYLSHNASTKYVWSQRTRCRRHLNQPLPIRLPTATFPPGITVIITKFGSHLLAGAAGKCKCSDTMFWCVHNWPASEELVVGSDGPPPSFDHHLPSTPNSFVSAETWYTLIFFFIYACECIWCWVRAHGKWIYFIGFRAEFYSCLRYAHCFLTFIVVVVVAIMYAWEV